MGGEICRKTRAACGKIAPDMKAVQFAQFGVPHEVATVVDVPEPGVPATGEVAVELLCSPINPADLLLLAGNYGHRPTCRRVARPRASIWARSSRTFGRTCGMRRCPPKPGLTLITSTRSQSSSTWATALTGVCGFRLTPASTRPPPWWVRPRICCRLRCR